MFHIKYIEITILASHACQAFWHDLLPVQQGVMLCFSRPATPNTLRWHKKSIEIEVNVQFFTYEFDFLKKLKIYMKTEITKNLCCE